MAGIRDKLIHDYVSVNLEVVWKSIHEDLPPLISQLDKIIEGRSTDSEASDEGIRRRSARERDLRLDSPFVTCWVRCLHFSSRRNILQSWASRRR